MPSMNERIQADLMDQERALWTSLTSADPVPAVKKLCNSDVNFILPQTPIVTLDSSGPSLKDVFQPPSYRFDSFSLENTRTIILGMMAGIITYQIKATRGRNMYNATGSSAWVQGSDGEWLLACHQETLLFGMMFMIHICTVVIAAGWIDTIGSVQVLHTYRPPYLMRTAVPLILVWGGSPSAATGGKEKDYKKKYTALLLHSSRCNRLFRTNYTMIVCPSSEALVWGQRWRSSPAFIVAAMGMALFTDMFLYTLIVPILPYMSEVRLGLDATYTQRMFFALLSQSALVSVILSPIIGHFADKTSTKRAWLLYALVVVLGGSIAVALATSAVVLFAGRLIQAMASSVMWVVGFSTIAGNVKAEHLGKTYGIVSVAIAMGTSAGPMVSGILFDLGGYWLAWSSAFAIIVVDIILRLLMLERPKESGNNNPSNGSHVNYQPDSENAPLLQTDRTPISPTTERTGLRFYTTLFRHRRFVGGCVSYLVFALLVSSFDTTLPLHVRAVFGWGSLPTGLLFMALQGPGIPFSPLCGWIKDRVGTCYPVAVGFLSLTPLMWLLGVPGDERFPWANGDRGPILYSVTVTMVGIMICLLNGTGTMEATMAVDEIQSKHPGIFGPNGGYSRALSISSLCWTLGTFIGPLLSGFLTEQVGYYEMGGVLAVVCLLSSINAFMNLGAEWDPVHGTD